MGGTRKSMGELVCTFVLFPHNIHIPSLDQNGPVDHLFGTCPRKKYHFCGTCLTAHEINKAFKQVVAVLGAGGGFRVILDGKHRAIFEADSAITAIEQ